MDQGLWERPLSVHAPSLPLCSLRDALVDSSSVTQTTHQVVTTTKKLVDGKVVSETSESQVIKN